MRLTGLVLIQGPGLPYLGLSSDFIQIIDIFGLVEMHVFVPFMGLDNHAPPITIGLLVNKIRIIFYLTI